MRTLFKILQALDVKIITLFFDEVINYYILSGSLFSETQNVNFVFIKSLDQISK